MCCTIQEATNVYCGSSCDSGFLKNEENLIRIAKSEIQSYQPNDIIPDYSIEFMMKNGMVIIWTFTTMTARDTALANVDAEMNTQNM
jgi:hypothetical protein